MTVVGCFRVYLHCTILALCLTVLADDISVEETARRAWVGLGLSSTGSSTATSVVRLAIVPVLVTNNGALSIAVIWRIYGAAVEEVRPSESLSSIDRLIHIAVGASETLASVFAKSEPWSRYSPGDNNVIVIPPLTIIDGVLGVDRTAPEDTLDKARSGWLVTGASLW